MKASPNHLPSLLSSILFILAGLFLGGIALFMGFSGLLSIFTGAGTPAQQTIFLAAFGFEAVVLFVAAFFALQKYRQKSAADEELSFSLRARQILTLVAIAFACILLGYLITGINALDWLVLPLLTVPAIVLPLVVVLALGTQGLPFGARWQTWTILGLGMSLGPFLLFVMEIGVGLIILIGAVAYIMMQPELVYQLQAIGERIMILGPQSEETVQLLSPYLTKPAVIGGLLLYIAVLVPAIEEIFKPIGVWLFAGKLRSPAQGFSLGALSGAGYALIETVGVSGQQSGEWASLLFSRIGTGLLHITTSALVGAAIVYAWRERRYARLLGNYLLAVILHGSWNALAMLFTFSGLAQLLEQPGPWSTLQPAMIVAMSIMVAGLLAILILSNRRLRASGLPPLAQADPVHDESDSGESI